ncbi:MAG TPA: winged helix DNA-binding domain-containing protein [Nitriliruptorales bacterium]|nr:winged helix DNA-binding domain-containing protein [Nitriliruptorales bacterium]
MTNRSITDAERRARVVARHHLGGTAPDVVGAVRALVAVHSSDPVTPYLTLWARVPDFATDDLDRALYDGRALCRLHAMRRTLFVVLAEEAPIMLTAAATAEGERRRLERWLAAEIDPDRVTAWLEQVEGRVVDVLAEGGQRRTQELTERVAELTTPITVGSGRWTAQVTLASRLLPVLAMEGRIVRSRPAGSWRSSQYRWAATTTWLRHPLAQVDAEGARAELGRRYLSAHGPATADDLAWWTGWSKRQTASVLASVGAVPIDLDGGREAFVLPGDLEPPPEGPRGVALLPGLDPTPMGWKDRSWVLTTAHADRLYDRNGNIGPTVWVDGRIVGGWAQRPDGEVVARLLEDVGAEAATSVQERAAALREWMAGVVVVPRFRTPLERELSA